MGRQLCQLHWWAAATQSYLPEVNNGQAIPVWIEALPHTSCRDQVCHANTPASPNKQQVVTSSGWDGDAIAEGLVLPFPLRTADIFPKAPKAKSIGSPFTSILPVLKVAYCISSCNRGLNCGAARGKINGNVSPSPSTCGLQRGHSQQGRICLCLSYDGTPVRDSPVSDFLRTFEGQHDFPAERHPSYIVLKSNS